MSNLDRNEHQVSTRIGLLSDRTGVPLFVLLCNAELSGNVYDLTDASQAPRMLRNGTSLLDRTSIQFIEAFFEAGGRRLVVQFERTELDEKSNQDELLAAILGTDFGFRLKTGLYNIPTLDSFIDLVAIPQAAIVFTAHRLTHLYQRCLDLSEQCGSVFVLIDPPRLNDRQALLTWCSSINHERGIQSYPWLGHRRLKLIPPSVLLAAHIQQVDEKFSVAESPANLAFSDQFSPIEEFDLTNAKSLLAARVNLFLTRPDRIKVMWGHATCLREASEGGIIPTARAAAAIREAVVQIVDPFLMEPRSIATCQRVESMLMGFFESISARRILAASTSKPNFNVSCYLDDQGSDSLAGFSIDIEYLLDPQGSYLSMKVGNQEERYARA